MCIIIKRLYPHISVDIRNIRRGKGKGNLAATIEVGLSKVEKAVGKTCQLLSLLYFACAYLERMCIPIEDCANRDV